MPWLTSEQDDVIGSLEIHIKRRAHYRVAPRGDTMLAGMLLRNLQEGDDGFVGVM